MLDIVIPEQHYEFYDEVNEVFLPPVNVKETKIQIEHSLISLKNGNKNGINHFYKTTKKLMRNFLTMFVV